MSGVKNVLVGEALFEAVNTISANLSNGEATGEHLTGVHEQSVSGN